MSVEGEAGDVHRIVVEVSAAPVLAQRAITAFEISSAVSFPTIMASTSREYASTSLKNTSLRISVRNLSCALGRNASIGVEGSREASVPLCLGVTDLFLALCFHQAPPLTKHSFDAALETWFLRLLPAELALLAAGRGVLFDKKVGVTLTRGLDLQSRPIGKPICDERV